MTHTRHWRLSSALAEARTLLTELAGEDYGDPPPPGRDAMPLPMEVVGVVATMLGSSVAEVVGGRRFKGAIRARHAAALALHRLGLSYPQISTALGLDDHTSAMNACARAGERETNEPAFLEAVAAGVDRGRAGMLPAAKMQRASERRVSGGEATGT